MKYIVEIEKITDAQKKDINSDKMSHEFMMHMYDQMFTTIDRRHKNIWEMVIAIGGGIGILKIFSYECGFYFDIAVIGYIIGLFWILARLIDANYWCNRNLFIIHEIERQLLDGSEENLFSDFRDKNRISENKYGTTIKIQIYFVLFIILLTVLSYLSLKFYLFEELFTNWRFYLIMFILSLSAIPALKTFFKRKNDFENKSL